jgi:hypothetical protein
MNTALKSALGILIAAVVTIACASPKYLNKNCKPLSKGYYDCERVEIHK